jgi:histidine triad (HIT) family protein
MNDCIFCKIVKGEVPSMKIYEDEFTFVFLDIAEDVNGHMVAVPKKHVNNILDCDNETLQNLIATVKLVSIHCVEKCGYSGVNFLNASDESAGQSVPHFHIHIIPRKSDDGIDAWPNFKGSTVSNQDMYELLRIK